MNGDLASMMSAKARATPSSPSSSTSIARSEGSPPRRHPRRRRAAAPTTDHPSTSRARCARASGRTSVPLRSRTTRCAAATPPASWNTSTRLREVGDAREQRDVLGRETARVAAPAPVLVERADRVGGRGGEAELERDRRAAVAADLDQLARRSGVRAMATNCRARSSDAVARRHRARRLERERARGACQSTAFMRGFTAWSSAANSAAIRAGVARAAGVLQQEGVVERGALLDVEADRLGEAHADETGPHGVPRGGALREVEGARERGQHLGEADPPLNPELRGDAARTDQRRDLGLNRV